MDDWNSVPASTFAVAILAVAVVAALLAMRRRRDAPRDTVGPAEDPETMELHFTNFDEAPLEAVERAFERLVADGRIRVEPASRPTGPVAGNFALQIPDHVGPVFRGLLARARAVELVEVQVSIELDACTAANDPIGGWKLRADPEEIDLRLAPRSGHGRNDSGDVVLDATWSPRGSGEIVVHSTILHFLVRAVVGNSMPS